MFIDANILIIAYRSHDKRGNACRNFLRRVESGEQNATTSVLVLDEVLKTMSRLVGDVRAVSSINKIMEVQNLKILSVEKNDFEAYLEYFKQSMDVHDSLHLAVMKKHGVKTILSYDKDFDSIKGVKRVEP